MLRHDDVGKEPEPRGPAGFVERVKEKLGAAWSAGDRGEEMRAMLGTLGVEIKAGDKRDYVIEYKGLKMNPVRLLEGVTAAAFRARMNAVDLTEKAGVALLRRRAKAILAEQFKAEIAGDTADTCNKRGSSDVKSEPPTPRLRRKPRFDAPGL